MLRSETFVRWGVVLLAALLAIGIGSCGVGGGSGKGRGIGPTATITAPVGGTFTGDVQADYTLIDIESDPAFIQVTYSSDGGSSWKLATEQPGPPSDGTANLVASPNPGVAHVFVWDSETDVGPILIPNVILKIFPYDTRAGSTGTTGNFTIDNRSLLPMEVIEVSDPVWSWLNDEVVIRFSKPLDTASIDHQSNGGTFAAFRDTNTIPGGPFNQEVGTITYSGGNTELTYTPPSPFDSYREMRFVLTSGITDDSGDPLEQGTTVPSAPLSFTGTFPEQAFEIRFVPDVGPLTSGFVPDPGTDLWFIDFDTFGTFDSNLGSRGLRGPDPLVAAYAKDRVIGQILSTSSEKYLRAPDGTAISGAYRISFVAIRPPGTIGGTINRICLGHTHPLYWGAAWLDPGNARKEDDCNYGVPVGVFAGGIDGVNSTLSPGLSASDLSYVDGSYVLGTDPAMDTRFMKVRDVLWDWGHSLAIVTDHEIGHSVGLPHDSSSNLNIMRGWASPQQVSNPAVRFSSANHTRLTNNLGKEP